MFWVLVSYESPADHPTITEEERTYIEESIGESAKLLGPAEVSLPHTILFITSSLLRFSLSLSLSLCIPFFSVLSPLLIGPELAWNMCERRMCLMC